MKLPVASNRELGQHFLVDENILHVAGRLAELGPDDVVLEVGAGLGVLTVYLAERVRLVHAVEIDRGLEPHLRERLSAHDNVELVLGDALTLPLDALDPPPNKLVANLPYQIATPLVAESLDGLPTVDLWCVMVQREVADRLFAEPGTKSYGAVSVLVQLTAERTGFHPVARTVFRPPPNVDSALVAFTRTRTWGPEFAGLKRLVQGAFSHRRKTAANSLELSGFERTAVEAALEATGLDAGIRAERIEPLPDGMIDLLQPVAVMFLSNGKVLTLEGNLARAKRHENGVIETGRVSGNVRIRLFDPVGNASPNISMPVPPGMAAVMPTILSSVCACLISSLAKTEVKDGALWRPFSCAPVTTSNFVTPCILSGAPSAGA